MYADMLIKKLKYVTYVIRILLRSRSSRCPKSLYFLENNSTKLIITILSMMILNSKTLLKKFMFINSYNNSINKESKEKNNSNYIMNNNILTCSKSNNYNIMLLYKDHLFSIHQPLILIRISQYTERVLRREKIKILTKTFNLISTSDNNFMPSVCIFIFFNLISLNLNNNFYNIFYNKLKLNI